MLSDALQMFRNEIYSENNTREVMVSLLIFFTVCKNQIFMNSGLKVLPKGVVSCLKLRRGC